MNRLLFISIILCIATVALSQEVAKQYNYFLYDDYYLNPAYVGSNNHYSVNISNDLRFIGLGGASPQTFIMSAHSRVGEGYLFEKDGKINQFFSQFGNMALGMQHLYFKFGSQFEYNVGVTYGHHIPLSPNVKTKRPHKLVLALTPRVHVTGFDRSSMTDNWGLPISPDWDQLIPPFNEAMMKARFVFDVGAIYQTIFYDFGLTALNISNTKAGYDSDTIQYSDGELRYGLYDAVYSPKLVFDAKLKFMNIIDQKKLEVNFVPKTAIMYSPNSGDMEFFLDVSVNWNFYEMVTSIRRFKKYELATGLFINHKRNYKPLTIIQPYISVDFINFKVMYAHNYNPNVQLPGYYGGNQVSVTFNISRDATSRKLTNNETWK